MQFEGEVKKPSLLSRPPVVMAEACIACELQTYYRSSLLSLRKITAGEPKAEKTDVLAG